MSELLDNSEYPEEVQKLLDIFRELCNRADVSFGVFKHDNNIAHFSKYPAENPMIVEHMVNRFTAEYVLSLYGGEDDEPPMTKNSDIMEDLGLAQVILEADQKSGSPEPAVPFDDLTFMTERELQSQIRALNATAVFIMLVPSPTGPQLDLKIWTWSDDPLTAIGLLHAGYVFWYRDLDSDELDEDDEDDDDEEELELEVDFTDDEEEDEPDENDEED